MPKTVVRENETLDDALRRFKRQVNKAGTIQECRRRESFLKKGLTHTAAEALGRILGDVTDYARKLRISM